jgi:hypothetical protein
MSSLMAMFSSNASTNQLLQGIHLHLLITFQSNEKMFQFWLHTAFCSATMVIKKPEIDQANKVCEKPS